MIPKQLSEQPVVPRSGDEHGAGFDALYRAHRLRLTRLAYVITGSATIAEELVQDAFLRFYQRVDEVRDPPAFLHTVLTNLCRTYLRRAQRERRLSVVSTDTVEIAELDETWRAIQRLPARQRAVLALRYYQDLPEREIAAVLGCRVGTVKSAHHRALASLRKELS